MGKMEMLLPAFPQWGETLELGLGRGCVNRKLGAGGTKWGVGVEMGSNHIAALKTNHSVILPWGVKWLMAYICQHPVTTAAPSQ